jgi:hypothetical protein
MNTALTNSSRRLLFSLGVAAAVWLWLFMLYGHFLYQITPETLRPVWSLLGPLVLTFTDFLNPVFRSPLLFVGSYILGISAIIWAATRLVRHVISRLALIACGGAALVFLLVMPAIYGTYQIPVQAATGYDLHWITQPTNPFSSAFKQAQLTYESGCDYHLAGWSEEDTLYYTSDCWPGLWHHATSTGETNWSLVGNEEARISKSSLQRWNGAAYLDQPTILRESSAYPFLTLERVTSPSGRWEAVVVRWFYGPSDIVLISRGDDQTK